MTKYSQELELELRILLWMIKYVPSPTFNPGLKIALFLKHGYIEQARCGMKEKYNLH